MDEIKKMIDEIMADIVEKQKFKICEKCTWYNCCIFLLDTLSETKVKKLINKSQKLVIFLKNAKLFRIIKIVQFRFGYFLQGGKYEMGYKSTCTC